MPWRKQRDAIRRILIFRLGSLGDTVVALPSFHLIARAFPKAERQVLTNISRNARETDLDAVLGGTGLVDGYMHFDPGDRSPAALAEARRLVHDYAPELVVYLAEQTTRMRMLRHVAFFAAAGVTEIVGLPGLGADGAHRHDRTRNVWEGEADFLLRRIRDIGDARIDDPALWDLRFTAAELSEATALLGELKAPQGFVAVAPGAKVEVKDWGAARWQALVGGVSAVHRGLGLVTIGGPGDRERAALLAGSWRGPTLDLCGRVSPRVSAAVMAWARALLTHDSGPMHLAAAVGTPIVAIFSARAKPGIWFPRGENNRVLYRRVPCRDCGLEICTQYAKRCIESIGVDEALDAALELIDIAPRSSVA
ncbi:MAG: glycosyltransferase family 9 protein [Alphaproteobacteria bacterium]|nr:glycosyltransferase family 9 protein [Alphaproteobacteria bacterium]